MIFISYIELMRRLSGNSFTRKLISNYMWDVPSVSFHSSIAVFSIYFSLNLFWLFFDVFVPVFIVFVFG